VHWQLPLLLQVPPASVHWVWSVPVQVVVWQLLLEQCPLSQSPSALQKSQIAPRVPVVPEVPEEALAEEVLAVPVVAEVPEVPVVAEVPEVPVLPTVPVAVLEPWGPVVELVLPVVPAAEVVPPVVPPVELLAEEAVVAPQPSPPSAQPNINQAFH